MYFQFVRDFDDAFLGPPNSIDSSIRFYNINDTTCEGPVSLEISFSFY